MTDSAVAVESLTKVFPVPFRRQPIVAVRDLNLRVERREVYGLLGPNGSGKSTTLKIVLGLVSPTRGTTKIFGRDSSLVESRESVGFLPENPSFYDYLTPREYLDYAGRLFGLDAALRRDRTRDLLEKVGLTPFADMPARRFSATTGSIAVTTATAGVDPAGSRHIRDLIVDLKKRGVSVLLSSHLLSQVQEICDRVGILAKGTLVREGRLEELLSVENRRELVLENASESLLAEIETLAASSNARLIERRRSTTTLERLFLDATQGIRPANHANKRE